MDIPKQYDLTNKVAIVTGASKGIGEAISWTLGRQGAKVILCSRSEEILEKMAQDMQKEGIKANYIATNTGNIEDLERLVKFTEDTFGGIDLVVNNAAANPVFGPIQETTSKAFDKIMDVNLKGPFELANLAYPIMQKGGGGNILNISSIGGISPERSLGVYSVSKAALISLTKVQAKEWGRDNIRANVICPGLIKTKFSEALWSNEKLMDSLIRHLPIPRVGTSEEIAALALFLCSEASTYCTGAVFTADGGYTI